MITRTPHMSRTSLHRQFFSSWAPQARAGILALVLSAGLAHAASDKVPQGQQGYYRQPALSGDTIVFVSEGDLWKVSLAAARNGNAEKPAVATRLTTHPGDESNPRISPDGQWIAFNAQYEGPNEVYIMPLTGGLPTRLTFDGARSNVVGWKKAHAGKPAQVMVTTNRYSTLPNAQLTLIDPATLSVEQVPLAQVSDGTYTDSGSTLFFTRLPFQGSQTKRYKGGTIQQLWKFSDGDPEATPLTIDYPGTSYAPMLTGPAEGGEGRVIFLSDRDGTMELWSMTHDGKDLKQLTDHNKPAAEGRPDTRYLDIKGPSLDNGRIVYQLGADLWVFDVASTAVTKLTITLDSDFDQMRERWVKRPIEYLTAANISHEGDRVAITARGTIFIFPKAQGRVVELPRNFAERNRSAIFMPDGKDVLTISDRSGETELWLLPSNGIPPKDAPNALGTQLTSDSTVLRFGAVPSPDGNYIATFDKDQRLHLVNVKTKQTTLIASDPYNTMNDLAWSADSRWLAYTKTYDNTHRGIQLYSIESGQSTPVTTDRYESYSPAWSTDGKWLYFISDRHLVSTVGSPWGPRAPEPYFENTSRIYSIALLKGERWPFLQDDELNPPKKEDKKDDKKPTEKPDPSKKEEPNKEPVPSDQPSPTQPTPPQPTPVDPKTPTEQEPSKDPATQPAKDDAAKEASKEDKKEDKKPNPIKIDLDGITGRLYELPLAPGNYDNLIAQEKRLLFTSTSDGKRNLTSYPIANKDLETKVIVPEISSFNQSGNGKALLVRKGQAIHILEASAGPNASLDKTAINLSGWTFSITPREEWQQMYIEAWRLMRDYFWDSNMHGVDWNAMRDRYLPLAQRVATRGELNDAIAQLVGELSALHIFVRGGDQRSGDTDINPATLGGILTRDDVAGGYRITKIFQSDPDEPTRRSPLAAPGVDLSEGDVIESVNGRPALSAPHINALLRGQAGKQVLLAVRIGATQELRQVIITPISSGSEEDLRYHEWQLTRRQAVDAASNNEIGYVHLRAMGNENFTEFAKGFYPIFNRKGLILDARHNRGGNIDSWILSRLMRKAWFYWSPDVGLPYWNMHYAFRGHIVVLCNERTASDGEALAEGIRRLKIGTIIGTRTWGGEIWLTSSNTLVDGGIASAAEIGVYGPEGEWLIEGHGVDPDVIVDNPPHATFKGEDAQLKAAIEYLQKKIKDEPVDVPPTPKRPDKSFTEK